MLEYEMMTINASTNLCNNVDFNEHIENINQLLPPNN